MYIAKITPITAKIKLYRKNISPQNAPIATPIASRANLNIPICHQL